MTKKKIRLRIARALKVTGVRFVERHQAAKLLLKEKRSLIHDENHCKAMKAYGLELIWHSCPDCNEYCVSSIEEVKGPKGAISFHDLYTAASGQI